MTPDAFAPATLGPVRLRNRIIKAATFEGVTPECLVTDALIDFHRRVAAGGVGMTTVAYCAVSLDGPTDGHQIHMRAEARPGLLRLTEAIHAEGAPSPLRSAMPDQSPTRVPPAYRPSRRCALSTP